MTEVTTSHVNDTLVTNDAPSKSWLVALLLPAFGLIVSLGLIEVAFRVVAPGMKKSTWSDRPTDYFLPARARNLQDDLPHKRDPSVFRIVVVGDSFTFGPHMQLDDTFPKRLERLLNLDMNAQRVEVLNRGVSGSSTVDEVGLVEKALATGADLVVLEVTLNDAEPHALTPDERKAIFEDAYLEWGILSWWKSLGFVLSRVHNSQSVKRYIQYHSRYFVEPETFARFDGALGRMGNAAQQAHIPLVATVFPLFDFPINDRYPFAETHEIVGRALADHQIPSLDLQGAYRDIPPERLQVIPGVDNHPNEIAHRIAAEQLLAFLAVNHWVPEGILPSRVFAERKHLVAPHEKPARAWSRAMRRVQKKQ